MRFPAHRSATDPAKGPGAFRQAAPRRPRLILVAWALGTLVGAFGWWLAYRPVDGYRTQAGVVRSEYGPCQPRGNYLPLDGSCIFLDDPGSMPNSWLPGDRVTAFMREITVHSGGGTYHYDHVAFVRIERDGQVSYLSRGDAPVGSLESDLQSQHRRALFPLLLGGLVWLVTVALVLVAPRRRSLLVAELSAAMMASPAVLLLIPDLDGSSSPWGLLLTPLLWFGGLVLGTLGRSRSSAAGDGRGYGKDLVVGAILLPLVMVLWLFNAALHI